MKDCSHSSINCRGSAAAAGILIRSWNASDEGGAAIVYDWERGVLEAIFEGDSDIGSQAELDASHESQKRFGGPVDMQPDKAVQVHNFYLPESLEEENDI